jgi:hypothetical protein
MGPDFLSGIPRICVGVSLSQVVSVSQRAGIALGVSLAFDFLPRGWSEQISCKCPTYPEYFAISAQLPDKGAVVHIHNTNYLQAQPSILSVDTRPHMIQDFDFLALRGIPRIAAAVGRTLVVFSIGVDS